MKKHFKFLLRVFREYIRKGFYMAVADGILADLLYDPVLFYKAKSVLSKNAGDIGLKVNLDMMGISPIYDSKGGRKTGKTTRAIDQAIQSIFTYNKAFIIDTSVTTHSKAEKTVEKVMKRLEHEHNGFSKQLQYRIHTTQSNLDGVLINDSERKFAENCLQNGVFIIELLYNRYGKF